MGRVHGHVAEPKRSKEVLWIKPYRSATSDNLHGLGRQIEPHAAIRLFDIRLIDVDGVEDDIFQVRVVHTAKFAVACQAAGVELFFQ